MPLQKMDADTKMEIIINLAFGTPLSEISKKYDIQENRIINLRKNNYKLYNQVSEEFYIIDEVAILGLPPLYERAVNIVKRRHKDKFQIISNNFFKLDNKSMFIDEVMEIANEIIAKDEIPPLQSIPNIKNNYASNKKQIKRTRTCRLPKQKK
mgnify:CR=1 FL=1